MARIYDIETLIVRSETEALLLEQNLIKLHRPPYNIMLRDDKSYVYIFISSDKPYPRIASGRGKGKHQQGSFLDLIQVPIMPVILCWFYKNSLTCANVKTAIFPSVNGHVCSIKLNAVPRHVWV